MAEGDLEKVMVGCRFGSESRLTSSMESTDRHDSMPRVSGVGGHSAKALTPIAGSCLNPEGGPGGMW